MVSKKIFDKTMKALKKSDISYFWDIEIENPEILRDEQIINEAITIYATNRDTKSHNILLFFGGLFKELFLNWGIVLISDIIRKGNNTINENISTGLLDAIEADIDDKNWTDYREILDILPVKIIEKTMAFRENLQEKMYNYIVTRTSEPRPEILYKASRYSQNAAETFIQRFGNDEKFLTDFVRNYDSLNDAINCPVALWNTVKPYWPKFHYNHFIVAIFIRQLSALDVKLRFLAANVPADTFQRWVLNISGEDKELFDDFNYWLSNESPEDIRALFLRHDYWSGAFTPDFFIQYPRLIFGQNLQKARRLAESTESTELTNFVRRRELIQKRLRDNLPDVTFIFEN